MFENLRRGRQARNFATNVSKILDLKSSSEQILFRKLPLGAPGLCVCPPLDHNQEPIKMLVEIRLLYNLTLTNPRLFEEEKRLKTQSHDGEKGVEGERKCEVIAPSALL